MFSPSSSRSSSPASISSKSSSSPRSPFANPICIPLKSSISPPATFSFASLVPPSPTLLVSSSPNLISCAYPSWPNRHYLSSPFSGNDPHHGSSYISDDDLRDVVCGSNGACGLGIVYEEDIIPVIPWEVTRQEPPVMIQAPVVRRPMPVRVETERKKRRRSSPLKRKRCVVGMSPIPEGAE